MSQNNELYDYEKLSPPAAVKDNIVTESNITSDPIEVVEQRAAPEVKPLVTQEQTLNSRQPYLNNFQKLQVNKRGIEVGFFRGQMFQQSQRHGASLQSYTRPGPGGLDILGYGKGSDIRPTLDSLAQYAASQGKSVTTPEDLLDMCCQFPACYDPLYELCIDTCRKCETVYPVTSWLPCPPLLNIPDCTSPNLSYMVSILVASFITQVSSLRVPFPLSATLTSGRSATSCPWTPSPPPARASRGAWRGRGAGPAPGPARPTEWPSGPTTGSSARTGASATASRPHQAQSGADEVNQ